MKAQAERSTKVETHLTEQRLDTAVIRNTRGFAVLEEEWAELYEDCPAATPFQSWAWLYSWWEHYGQGYELRLITVKEGGLLVGLLPLMLERRWGFGRLLFVGSGATDYHDVLAREGWESAVAEAIVAVLERMSSWQVADLQELRPQAVAWSIHSQWEGPRTDIWQVDCVLVEVKPWEQLLASLSRNHRKTARRTLRRAEEDGVRSELAKVTVAEEAARKLVDLHRELWRGRGIALEQMTRRFEAHLETAVRRMTACGLGAISEFRRDGETVVSTFLVFGRAFAGTYLVAASEQALQRYSFSSLYILDAVSTAHNKNLQYLSLLRGVEPYKLRWSSRVVPNRRLIWGRHLVVLAAYTGYHVLRSRVEAYARSDNIPRWLKKAVVGYRALRLRAVRRLDGASK